MGFSETLAAAALGLSEYVESLGPTGGPVAFIALFTVWVCLGLPGTLLEMVPGFLFGYKTGVFCNMAGKQIGNTISFFAARAFSARAIAWGGKYKGFRLCKKAVDSGGFWAIFTVRMCPIPMTAKNWGLGALGADTKMTFIASFWSALPFALVWTWFGTECKSLADMFQKGGDEKKASMLTN